MGLQIAAVTIVGGIAQLVLEPPGNDRQGRQMVGARNTGSGAEHGSPLPV